MDLGFIQSIFFFFGVFSLIYGAAIPFFPGHNDRQAVFHWSLGCLVWGCSIIVTVFRQELPLLLTYYGANAVAFFALIELNRALKALVGTALYQSPRRWLDGLVVVVYACMLYAIGQWAPAEYSTLIKTSFVSALVMVVSLQGATYCFELARVHHLKLAHGFGYLYLAVAVLWLARILSAVVFQTANAFDPAGINTVIWLLVFISGTVKYIVFPMLLQQKTENNRQAQLRNSLVKANKTVASGALSASIAHELNQPLASIRLNGQVLRQTLQNQGAPSQEARAMIDDILSENERAAKIIKSLRAIFSHNVSEPHEIEASALIRKSVGLLATEIGKHQIRLELQLEDELRLAIPEDELHQVLLNLLLNSIQALQDPLVKAERVIVIASRRRGRQAQIRISDTGPGVLPSMESVLFEILSTSKDSGMGVGLWLCKYIVERYEGRITYASAPGGGAVFTITMPLCADRPLEPGLRSTNISGETR